MRSTTGLILAWLTLFTFAYASPRSDTGCPLPPKSHATTRSTASVSSVLGPSKSSQLNRSSERRSSTAFVSRSLPSSSVPSSRSRAPTSSAGISARFSSSTSCVGTTVITITATSTPVTTTTSYANVVKTFIDEGPTFYTYIITTSFTSLEETLTSIFAITPSSIVGVTSTYIEPTPSGFRPVQDTLEGATYIGARIVQKRQGSDVHAQYPRPAKVCTFTTTIVQTASPSTFTFTQTSPVSIIILQGVPRTIVLGVDAIATTTTYTTITFSGTQYASTTTTTITAVPPVVTQYAACSNDNFADYVSVSGTLIAIETFENRTNLDVVQRRDRFDCCTYAIQQNASVFAYLSYDNNGYCAVLYPVDQPKQTCLGPGSPEAQFRALLRNAATEVIGGNAYCGQLNSYLVSS